jgi:hypothetical protein
MEGSPRLTILRSPVIRCNAWKGSDIASLGVEPIRISPLFHPRQDRWRNHFRLEAGEIFCSPQQALQPFALLRLNLLGRITERRVLIQCERYPPNEP